MMTIGELTELLADLDLDPDTEVRFASQPSYSLDIALSSEVAVVDATDEDGEDETVLFLAEGRHNGYLPGVARDELGW